VSEANGGGAVDGAPHPVSQFSVVAQTTPPSTGST
jgi:hypothetical protein